MGVSKIILSKIIVLVGSLICAHWSLANENSDFNKLDQYLKASVADGFSGAVLVVQDDIVQLKHGYGLVARDSITPINADTLFDIGSVTKQFTAAAIMQLVQQGRLNTSMHLSDFFKNLPQDKQNITLHQLLTHSSGLANGIGAGDFDQVPTDAFFSRLFALPLYFAPGDGYAYSNAGYSVLARIIELVSGTPYEDYLQTALFKPAGMMHTGYLKSELSAIPAAQGYLYGEIQTGSTRDRYFNDGAIAWPLKGNGGILSTLNDMYLWFKALNNDSVLTAKYRHQLFAPHVAEDDEGSSHYGYGWAVMETPRQTAFIGHNGSNGTYYFDFRWFPDEQSLIILASNALVESTMALSLYIEQFLFEGEPMPGFEKGITSDIVRLLLDTTGNPEHKKSVLKKHFANIIDNKRTLNRAGLRLLDAGYYDDAIALLLLNVELYSDDGNLWDSLGEAYFGSQQFDAATHAYEQALKLSAEPDCFWCENSNDRLKQISESH